MVLSVGIVGVVGGVVKDFVLDGIVSCSSIKAGLFFHLLIIKKNRLMNEWMDG